jgi:PAT family beta-lactamase induction signal transducer AmpG
MRGRRRPWLLLAQAALAASLIGMALVGPGGGLLLFVTLAALVAFSGATQDTLVDAYRIEIAPLDAQAALAATYSFGYRLGLIGGGAGALYLAEFGGWRTAYLCMAAAMAAPLLATLLSAEPAQPHAEISRPNFRAAFVAPFLDFFAHRGLLLGLALLVFVGLFKLPDQMLGVVAGPFYIDSGYDKAQIATVSKLYGVWIGLAGAFLGGFAVAAYGVRRCLLVGAIAVAVSNLAFLLMAQNPGATWAFIATISADNLSQGFAGTVLVAFMSGLTQSGHTATQYALLSSLANLPGKLIGGGSGFLVEAWSYSGFFIFSTLSILPTLLLLAWLWARLPPRPHPAPG